MEKLKEVSSWSKSVIKAESEKKDAPKKEKNKNAEKRKNEKVEEQECTDDVCVPCLLPRKKKAKGRGLTIEANFHYISEHCRALNKLKMARQMAKNERSGDQFIRQKC